MTILAALLVAAAQPPVLGGHYRCELSSDEDGWTSLTSRVHADGSDGGTFGSWYGRADPGSAGLSIHWQFMLDDSRPHRAYVQIAVPLRGKLTGARILRLVRGDTPMGSMALAAAATPVDEGRRANASVELRTLLDYSGEHQELSWELGRPEAFRGAIASGSLGLPRVKAAVKRLEPLLDELDARRADFRNRCTYDPEPIDQD